MGSTLFRLNTIDWKKIGKGFLIAMFGAGLTYLEELIPGISFGIFTSLAVAANSVLVNAVRKFLSGWNE